MLKRLVLVSFVVVTLAVAYLAALAVREINSPVAPPIYYAGCFTFGWYSTRIFSAWKRLLRLP